MAARLWKSGTSVGVTATSMTSTCCSRRRYPHIDTLYCDVFPFSSVMPRSRGLPVYKYLVSTAGRRGLAGNKL